MFGCIGNNSLFINCSVKVERNSNGEKERGREGEEIIVTATYSHKLNDIIHLKGNDSGIKNFKTKTFKPFFGKNVIPISISL
jgi:hypothetical protein